MRLPRELRLLPAALGTALAIAVLAACSSDDQPSARVNGEGGGPAAGSPSIIATPGVTGDDSGGEVVQPPAPAGTAVNPLPTPTSDAPLERPTATPIPTALPGDSELGAQVTRSVAEERDLEIVSILPRDAIPAIWDPEFLTVEEATDQMPDTELVIGLSIDGEHRAYSVPFLSRHEIVNDIVGGKPVAVTW